MDSRIHKQQNKIHFMARPGYSLLVDAGCQVKENLPPVLRDLPVVPGNQQTSTSTTSYQQQGTMFKQELKRRFKQPRSATTNSRSK
jgi:hypothetical protein